MLDLKACFCPTQPASLYPATATKRYISIYTTNYYEDHMTYVVLHVSHPAYLLYYVSSCPLQLRIGQLYRRYRFACVCCL